MANENQIKVKYKYEDDYNPQYVNGAQGGINVQGEIVVNFYFERVPMPNSVTHEVSKEGLLGPAIATEPEDLTRSVLRYVQSGVVMNLEVATQIHRWLGDQIALRKGQLKVK